MYAWSHIFSLNSSLKKHCKCSTFRCVTKSDILKGFFISIKRYVLGFKIFFFEIALVCFESIGLFAISLYTVTTTRGFFFYSITVAMCHYIEGSLYPESRKE